MKREARSTERRLPRVAVLALAALIVSFPAVLAAGEDYRKTPQGLVKHRHTDSYGVYNWVGSADQSLHNAVRDARIAWDQKLVERDTIRMPAVLSAPAINVVRQSLGLDEVHAVWDAPYHPTSPTLLAMNSDKMGGISNSLKQGIACKAFGGIMGLEASGPQGGCMADSANETPSNTSADNLDRFYGPNIDLSGSLYVNRAGLKPSHLGTYSLTATATGHAMRSISIRLDDQTIASPPPSTPCEEKCSVSTTVFPTEAQLMPPLPGQHTVSVTATNEFGRPVTNSFNFEVLPYWGIAELWRNLPPAQIGRSGRQPGGMGASTNRLDIGWGGVQPVRNGPFLWQREGLFDYEATYNAMVAGGQKPILTLQSAPAWAGASAPGVVPPVQTPRCLPSDDGDNLDDNEGCQFPPHPSHYDQWKTFVANAVCKFPQALAVEIWNEPNKGRFWRPNPDANAYANLLHAADEAMDELYDGTPTCVGAPSKRPPLLVGGLAPIDPDGFLETIYAFEENERPDPRPDFEGIGLHSYPVGSEPADRANDLIAEVKEVTDARDLADNSDAEIWLTEVGVPADPGGQYGTEAEQGPSLVKIYQAAGPLSYPDLVGEEALDASVLLMYRWQDGQVGNDPQNFRYMGLNTAGPEFEPKDAVKYVACALEGRQC